MIDSAIAAITERQPAGVRRQLESALRDAVPTHYAGAERVGVGQDHRVWVGLLPKIDGQTWIALSDIGEPVYAVRDVRFAGDDILVAQQTELRVYDEAGGLRERIGRAGGGPGEFERMVSAAFCDGRIIASEMYSRIVIFEADGTPRSLPLPRPSNPGLLTPLYLYACDRDHLYGTIADGVVRVHLADAAVDTLLVHAGSQIYDGLRVPFGRSTLVAIRDSVIHLVDTARPEIRMHGLGGELLRIVRLNLDARPVTAADIDRIRAQYLDGLPPALEEEIRPRLDAVTIPVEMPFFSAFELAPDGTMWLRAYQPFSDESVLRWTVIAADGTWLGDVEMPAGFTVHDVSEESVLGVWRDELDVEYVRAYALPGFQRPSGSSAATVGRVK